MHELRREDGSVVCERCKLADSAPARLRGLLGRKSLPPDEGVLLRPAGSVHTAFMRFSIDVVFLDRELAVLDVVHELAPWRAAARRGAKAVLELAAGEAARRTLVAGDRLALSSYAAASAASSPGS
ncbi:MAG: DUF192 domain-containing protein [Actinomycetota bacterium]|nr:DUF192 domain-containing protein [Actinomycetota bacterium]